MKKQMILIKIPFASLLLILTTLFSSVALSEITLDGSMGATGSLAGPNYQITEDLGQHTGSNLFHSFGQFNINSAESATFSGSAGIKNVVSRVTDGQTSTIDGAFRSTIPGANVYFLNPSGVIFGENASLDVQGSFHASTADYLKFKDGVKFETGLANNPLLTVASPEAFGFLDDTPAPISVLGGLNKVLKVPEGETLSLVAGDITVNDRSLYAPSGQVILASAGSAGEVVFNESGIDTSSFSKGGNIHLSRLAENPVSIINDTMQIADIDVSADAAGKVVIRGGQMMMDNTYIWANTTDKEGGDIDIGLAGDLTINGVAEIAGVDKTPSSGITADTKGEGNAGNIILNVDDLKLTHKTRIGSTASSSGHGGDLLINANSILLEGNDSKAVPYLITSTTDFGNAGNINALVTDNIEINNRAYIWSSSSAEGIGGDLSIETNELKIDNAYITSFGLGSGNRGDINITVNNVTALNSAKIQTIVSGTGKGGGINVVANETISLTGKNTFLSSDTYGKGNSGNISVTSDSLDIRNGASITSTTKSEGNAGDLFIDSNKITLTNDNTTWIDHPVEPSFTGIQSSIDDVDSNELATGNTGNLTVISKHLIASNGASIAIRNFGHGDGGNLSVESDDIKLTTDIDVGIYTSSISNKVSSTGNTGNLTVIAHNNLVVENGANIDASSTGSGDRGNLTVDANHIFLSGNNAEQKTGILNIFYPGSSGVVGGYWAPTIHQSEKEPTKSNFYR